MARSKSGLTQAIADIRALREDFWTNVSVPGDGEGMTPALEHAGRVADFLEFGELMCRDALTREESCGGHFRTEYQDEGEARRDDAKFAHVAAWEWKGEGAIPDRHTEALTYEEVAFTTRSYK